jgi:hypothetical protein
MAYGTPDKKPSKRGAKGLTCEKSLADFESAYRAKAALIKRQKEDFLFRLGKQWDDEVVKEYEGKKIKVVTDNRIAANVRLLAGMERQNRADWKAYPEGEEDSLKAAVASALLKDTIKKSDFGYKSSDCFEDGITCGESNLELYLDYTYNLLNGKPCWKKIDGNQVFPEPGWKEYDYADARYVYKFSLGLSCDDLIALFPDKKSQIEAAEGGELDFESLQGGEDKHVQPRDYTKKGNDSKGEKNREPKYDLLERYYKKYVDQTFIADRETGEVKEAEDDEKANQFISDYVNGVQAEQQNFQTAVQDYQGQMLAGGLPEGTPPPQEPIAKDVARFFTFTRPVPEIWCFAHVPGMKKPLVDERAWFYPKWKSWPIIPYLADFSTAPIDGDDAHLKVQGLVCGVKSSQELHNKAETIKLLHMQSSTNGGWLTPKGAWVNEDKVQNFGSMPGVNLEYDPIKGKPERIFPMPAQAAWQNESEYRVESIKAQLGINSDLLAAQEGGTDSGRAIALRQKQGVIMVQKYFDNYSRTKQISGRLALSQLGEIYDVESSKKVLGDAFLIKNFPPMTVPVDDGMGNLVEKPIAGPDGQPMKYDTELADAVIKEVLEGNLDQYDVSIGEVVASETLLMAQNVEIKELAQMMPQAFTPDMLIETSNLPASIKGRAIQNAQRAQMAMAQPQGTPPLAAA